MLISKETEGQTTPHYIVGKINASMHSGNQLNLPGGFSLCTAGRQNSEDNSNVCRFCAGKIHSVENSILDPTVVLLI